MASNICNLVLSVCDPDPGLDHSHTEQLRAEELAYHIAVLGCRIVCSRDQLGWREITTSI